MQNRFGRKGAQTDAIPPFLLLVSLGFSAFIPVVTPEVLPVALAAVVEQRTEHNSLPVALTLPIPLAVVPPKVVAVAAPNTVVKLVHARLIIPAIGVNAIIRDMGFTPEGAMAVPGNRVDVGWFSPGTLPGDIGSAVIGGHNEWGDGSGVFVRLDQLKAGDLLSVVDANGGTTSFVVRGMRTFAPTDNGKEIFSSADGIHLNLITCSGVWDPTSNSYSERLVVFTDLVPEPSGVAFIKLPTD